MVDQSKEAMHQVFKSIDKDNSGFLDPKEISQLSKELGKELSDQEINQIFSKIDTNHDGKLSFEEFYTWWLYGASDKFEALIYYKLKAMKLIEKAQVKLNKLGGLLSNKIEKEYMNSYVAIQVNDAPPKTQLGIKGLFGTEASQYRLEQLNGLHEIDQNTPAIVIKIRSSEPDTAIESFRNIFEQLTILLESMLPPQIVEQFIPTIKFHFGKPDPNYIAIGITCTHEMVSSLHQMLMAMHPDLFSDQINTVVSLKYSSPLDGNTFIEKQDANVGEFLQQGFNLEIDAKVNHCFVEKYREYAYGIIETHLDQGNINDKKFKKLVKTLPILLLSGAKAVLKFKKFEDITSLEPATAQFNLQNAKQMAQQANASQMLKEIPLAEDVLNTFKNYCQSDITISFLLTRVCFAINFQSDGFQKLFDFVLGE